MIRFPSYSDVAKACYSDHMTLRSCGVIIRLAPWSANVGAKGEMELAWVKVKNIPNDKRSDRNVAYVSSLDWCSIGD